MEKQSIEATIFLDHGCPQIPRHDYSALLKRNAAAPIDLHIYQIAILDPHHRHLDTAQCLTYVTLQV